MGKNKEGERPIGRFYFAQNRKEKHMRTLTIADNWKDWKFGDTDAVMAFTALDDDKVPDFSDRTLTFKIASTLDNDLEHPKDFAATATGYVQGKNVILKTEDVKQLTPGNYIVELWAMSNDTQKDAVYPSKGFAQFTIEENSMKVSDVTNVPSMTINAFWNAVMQKVRTLTKGAKGDPGKTPKIVIGSVTKLSPDAQPSATLVPLQSDPNTYTLNLQLPQGVQGEQGLQGIPGVGSKGLDGNNGLTPTIDPKTKHWMIGGTDTGVIAEGQAGKDADPSKYVTIVSFNQLRQQVQNNATALDVFKQTLQETVQNTLDEFQSQFNGPAFQEAQQASLDTDMMYGEAMPPYFQDSFNHVTKDVPNDANILNIATIADAHWQEEGATIFDGYTAKSLEHYQWCALSTLYNHADALIALGDNINGDEPAGRLNMTLMHVRAMLQTKYVRTAMFMIRGNHDNGAGHQNTEGKSADEVLDDNAVKNGFGTKFNYYGEVRDGDSFYFYKDFPEKKVRIIGLDSNDIPLEKKDSNGHYAYDTKTAGFRAQQLNWFANKALMLPDNTWQVVVFFHIPFPNAFGQWAEDNTFVNYHHAIAILNAFKNGTSVNINDISNPDFTITGLQADYSKQGQGTLIAVVNGHLHCDDQDTSILNGTPIIEVTTSASFVSSVVNDSKQRNTNDEDAWDIISINTKERKIHCYRFGRGSDRDFTY